MCFFLHWGNKHSYEAGWTLWLHKGRVQKARYSSSESLLALKAAYQVSGQEISCWKDEATRLE